VASLVQLDDPDTLLDRTDLEEMRARLDSLRLPTRAPKKSIARRAPASSMHAGDVMEDIADLLEDD
jgi:hypothetical protein